MNKEKPKVEIKPEAITNLIGAVSGIYIIRQLSDAITESTKKNKAIQITIRVEPGRKVKK